MTESEARREARIAAAYRGGTWHVARLGNSWEAVAGDQYDPKHGEIVATFERRFPGSGPVCEVKLTPECPGCTGSGYHSEACNGGWGPSFLGDDGYYTTEEEASR